MMPADVVVIAAMVMMVLNDQDEKELIGCDSVDLQVF